MKVTEPRKQRPVSFLILDWTDKNSYYTQKKQV